MEGDCNSDNDCMPGLICGKRNCPKDVGYDIRADCCEHVAVVFTPSKYFILNANSLCNSNENVFICMRYHFKITDNPFFLAFGFKKVESKECDETKYGDFSDFDEAKLVCKSDKTCASIYDVGCGNQKKYHLCPEDEEKPSSESCIYLKFAVGE